MLIYAENITPRLRYAASFILGELLGLKIIFSNVKEEGVSYQGPVINYSHELIRDSFHILDSGFLAEHGIRALNPIIRKQNEEIHIFPADSGNIDFDIFSAAFYLMSRYEEYLPFGSDHHGRFPATESLAYRNGFLEIPVINRWANKLGRKLKQKFPSLVLTLPASSFLPTIDIDVAWSVRNKGLYRTIGGIGRQVLKADLKNLISRFSILAGSEPDPYDTYDYIVESHNANLIIFMLAGQGGKYDLNNPVTNPEWKALVRNLSEKYNIGFHPSYHSGEKPKVFRNEKQTIEQLTGKPLTRVRQHFLRLAFPSTYRHFAGAGLTEDYSMGYADKTGFRAGTSSPFYFYDLEKEDVTKLKIFPFTVMDRTLKDYLKLNPDEAFKKIKLLASVVKEEGGCFIPVWHNDSLCDTGEWEGWRIVYEKMYGWLTETFGNDKLYRTR